LKTSDFRIRTLQLAAAQRLSPGGDEFNPTNAARLAPDFAVRGAAFL
jgi:hypothetical protein